MIIDILKDFRRAGNAGIHLELAAYLRGKIESGMLESGEKLPSLRELAKLWNTNLFSVKLATDELVYSGLLNKQHGRGMFVAPRAGTVKRIGLYTSCGLGSPTDLAYYSMLRELLCAELRERGIGYLIFDDCRPREQHGAIPEDLQRAILGNEIQAVIGVITRTYDRNWFNRLPIKKTCLMYDPHHDFDAMARQLAEHGCRRIAVIAAAGNPEWPSSFLTLGLKSANIRIMARNTRIIPENAIDLESWGEIGYRNTMELLTLSPRPDALIVYPDNAVPGAIQAILELGIKVPEELFVLFHRNLELRYFCSLDACFFDTRIHDIAKELLDRIMS